VAHRETSAVSGPVIETWRAAHCVAQDVSGQRAAMPFALAWPSTLAFIALRSAWVAAAVMEQGWEA
jgi:hypothetical protein